MNGSTKNVDWEMVTPQNYGVCSLTSASNSDSSEKSEDDFKDEPNSITTQTETSMILNDESSSHITKFNENKECQTDPLVIDLEILNFEGKDYMLYNKNLMKVDSKKIGGKSTDGEDLEPKEYEQEKGIFQGIQGIDPILHLKTTVNNVLKRDYVVGISVASVLCWISTQFFEK